ncbi:hypothetical protein A2U01_0078048, partial [Trifolium medium]|nr:hypothetical protein [Trifolium medium]
EKHMAMGPVRIKEFAKRITSGFLWFRRIDPATGELGTFFNRQPFYRLQETP